VKGKRDPLVFDFEAGALGDIVREPRAHTIQLGSASGYLMGYADIIVNILAASITRASGDLQSMHAGVRSLIPKSGHPAQFRDRATADDRDRDALAQTRERLERRDYALNRTRHRRPADQFGNRAVVV
jgi:hypothetical protein